MSALTIPSPTSGVLWLGPFPLRGYALCILLGIVLAVVITGRRLARWRLGGVDEVLNVSYWAVPFGIVGGRLYHVVTTPQPYFGAGGRPMDALKVWEGGLGIWGAVMLGAVGAWIGCRRNGVRFLDFADALAPGLLVAQAAGRFGNWFNNEIYGRPTEMPWRLKIYHWDQSAGHALRDVTGAPLVKGYYHPTFLYEALWCLAVAGLIVLAARRFPMHRGEAIGWYVVGYTVGRFVIELMRTDSANHILGLRVNTWVSTVCLLLGIWIVLRSRARRPERAEPLPADDAPLEPGSVPKPSGDDSVNSSGESRETSATSSGSA